MALEAQSFCRFSPHIGFFRHRTNVGVIEAEAGLYLVDCGEGDTDGAELLTALKTLFPQKKLIAVLNTHGHPDHSGASWYLREHTGCSILAPKKESIFIENPDLLTVIYWGGRPFRELRQPVFEAQHPCTVDGTLSDQPVDDAAVDVRCIPLPGHFYDQAGILVKDKANGHRVFFVADAFFGISILRKYWIPYMQDEALFRESVQRIEKTPADTYLPAHGEPSGRETMQALAELNTIITYETEDLILKLLKKQPLTQEELLKEVADYAGIRMKLGQVILIGCTLRAYLSCMYNRGLVVFEVTDNCLLWKPAPGSSGPLSS